MYGTVDLYVREVYEPKLLSMSESHEWCPRFEVTNGGHKRCHLPPELILRVVAPAEIGVILFCP